MPFIGEGVCKPRTLRVSITSLRLPLLNPEGYPLHCHRIWDAEVWFLCRLSKYEQGPSSADSLVRSLTTHVLSLVHTYIFKGLFLMCMIEHPQKPADGTAGTRGHKTLNMGLLWQQSVLLATELSLILCIFYFWYFSQNTNMPWSPQMTVSRKVPP